VLHFASELREAEKGGRSKNPDAIDLAMRGFALLLPYPVQKDNNDAARALFERALAIDPNHAAALVGDAQTYGNEFIYGWINPQTDYDAKILGQADLAIALAPDISLAYRAKSNYLLISHRASEAAGIADASPNHG
jgi:adenylate cyclase